MSSGDLSFSIRTHDNEGDHLRTRRAVPWVRSLRRLPGNQREESRSGGVTVESMNDNAGGKGENRWGEFDFGERGTERRREQGRDGEVKRGWAGWKCEG